MPMSAEPSLDHTVPLAKLQPRPRMAWHISDFLLPVAIGLWAFGISKTDTSVIGAFGLPPLLPIVFYAGVALLVVSAVIELVRSQLSHWRMAIHAVVLTVMIYATAPLVYSAGRYAWLYKTIGVVQYVNAHGQLDGRIDIYQNWPGFFALTAWLGKVAGVSSPLAYAKWAQLLFELAALPLLYLIYEALALTARQRWVALLLVPASNWIGQDYFSPQALGTLLCLGIMAIAMRWLFVPQPAPRLPARIRRAWSRLRRAVDPPDRDPLDAQDALHNWPVRTRLGWLKADRRALGYCAVIVVIFFVLAMTHQLSPYMIAAQLGALAVFRMLRPWWLPIVLLAVAIAYLLPHFSYVNTHYGLLKSIGNLFSNATPPALTRTKVAPSQQLIEHCAEALSIGIWLLAILGAWRNRRSEKITFALVLLAFSPSVMLAMQAYGHEGILRVFLFSLPWAAALASMVIAPASNRVKDLRTVRDLKTLRDLETLRLLMSMGGPVERRASPVRRVGRSVAAPLQLLMRRLSSDAVRTLLALGIALTLFFPAFFGDDSFNFMSSQQVNVVTGFFESAPPGWVYSPVDDAPLGDTARYNQFPRTLLFGSYGMMPESALSRDVAKTLAQNAWHRSRSLGHAYVIITPSMVAYNEQYEVTPPQNFAILRSSLANSPYWQVVYNHGGIAIYQLLPRAK